MMKRMVVKAVEIAGFRQNPANGVRPSRWGLAVIETIEEAYRMRVFHHLLRWAMAEEVNKGSNFRHPWPANIPTDKLTGSGRWHAHDEGGHFRMLRKTLIRAFEECDIAYGKVATAANSLRAVIDEEWWPLTDEDMAINALFHAVKRAISGQLHEIARGAILYQGTVGCTTFVVVGEDGPKDHFYTGHFVVRVGKVYDTRLTLKDVEPHLDHLRKAGLDWTRVGCDGCTNPDPNCGERCTASWKVVRI